MKYKIQKNRFLSTANILESELTNSGVAKQV